MNRREFFRRSVAPIALAPFIPFEVVRRAVAVAGPRVRGTIKTKQTIAEINVGWPQEPRDAAYLVEFYRRSKPALALLHFALNQRATFRWVAPPGEEFVLAAGDVLEWRIGASSVPTEEVAMPNVHTMGHEVDTGRLIIDQAFYGDELDG